MDGAVATHSDQNIEASLNPILSEDDGFQTSAGFPYFVGYTVPMQIIFQYGDYFLPFTAAGIRINNE